MTELNIDRFIRFFADKENETTTFHFNGRLDTSVSTDLTTYIRLVIKNLCEDGFDKNTMKVVFDLDKVTFVSSTFLRVCFVVLKEIGKGNFSITNASQQINSILKISGLEKLTNILNKEENVAIFHPSVEFSKNASISSFEEYKKIYKESIDNNEQFWTLKAKENIVWFKDFDTVLNWNLPNSKWFLNGKLNASYNCLDKHLQTPIADKTAIIWEGEPCENGQPTEKKYITYKELHLQVSVFANVLKNLGISKGDRVIIYLPLIPEAVVAMLACARLGAIHSVIFGGFSSQSIAERLEDCQARLVITADGGFRRGKLVHLKDNVDKALENSWNNPHSKIAVEKVLLLERAGNAVNMHEGRDFKFNDEQIKVSEECEAEIMDSEDVLFILYTSGSTGKPKGIFHSTAGYLLCANLSFREIMDVKDDDIFWCTADIGWITGHTYVVYGPLSNGATVYLYEGAPDYPNYDRFWKIIEANKITIFYTAPTAIRAFMQWGDKWLSGIDLSSLRLLGTVGEPINQEAWLWYYEKIGKSFCPIVDTWWQTETGAIMLSPFPGATSMKPGSVAVPFWGIEPEIIDDEARPVPVNTIGNLVIKKPWPSMARGVWASAERFKTVYWNDFPGYYFTGDCARKDSDGFFWIVGRTDDVIVVSGHNIGTAEVENALCSHYSVAEAAVVGRPDDLKTTVIVAFVVLKTGIIPSLELINELKQKVNETLGHLAKPEEIRFTDVLPKTRSGKIIRRLLRQIAAGTEIAGDMTTLEDFSVIDKLSKGKI